MDAFTPATLTTWISTYADDVAAAADRLTALDSAIGDADHGSNMKRGFAAAAQALADESPATCKDVLAKVGMTLVSKVGGASGPLYGTFFIRMSSVAAESDSMDKALFGQALTAGLEGITARGKAAPGDKTLIDALAPAVAAYDDAADLDSAVRAAADAAEAGAAATVPMEARKGRASYLGERSVGHQDPGATSMAMLLAAAVKVTS